MLKKTELDSSLYGSTAFLQIDTDTNRILQLYLRFNSFSTELDGILI